MSAFPHPFHVPALARPGTLQRNLTLDLTAAMGLGTAMALVAALLPSLARLEGLSVFGLALLAATPFAASLLSIAAGRIGPRTPAGLAWMRAIGSAALLLVFVVPGPLVIVFATFVFWATFALGQPLQQRLWVTMYPDDRRAGFLGIVGTGRFAAGTIALLAVTLLIEGSAGRAIIAVIAVIGIISALAMRGLQVPATETQRAFGVRHALGSLREQGNMPRVTVAQLFYGAGIIAAAPLIALVQVDRLNLGLEQLALAGLTIYATTAMAFGVASRVAARMGGLRTIAGGATLGAAALVVLSIAPNLAAVLVAAILLGIASAAVNASWPLILADQAPRAEQAAVAAGIGTVMGARGLIAPFVLMLPVSAGVLSVTAGLLLCAAVTMVGALLYADLAGVRIKVGRRPTHVRALVGAFGSIGALVRF